MVTCFAIGGTLLSVILLALLVGSIACLRDGVRQDDDKKIARHICGLFMMLFGATFAFAGSVWLWQQVFA